MSIVIIEPDFHSLENSAGINYHIGFVFNDFAININFDEPFSFDFNPSGFQNLGVELDVLLEVVLLCDVLNMPTNFRALCIEG